MLDTLLRQGPAGIDRPGFCRATVPMLADGVWATMIGLPGSSFPALAVRAGPWAARDSRRARDTARLKTARTHVLLYKRYARYVPARAGT